MTANISQNVSPRRAYKSSSSWRTTQQNRRFSTRLSASNLQQGSIDSTTLTVSLGIIVIIAVALLGFFYLGQVLNTTSQGSDIQVLEERMVELRENQRQLELEGAELRSIENIEQHVKEINLVPTDHVAYINDPNLVNDYVAALPE